MCYFIVDINIGVSMLTSYSQNDLSCNHIVCFGKSPPVLHLLNLSYYSVLSYLEL